MNEADITGLEFDLSIYYSVKNNIHYVIPLDYVTGHGLFWLTQDILNGLD